MSFNQVVFPVIVGSLGHVHTKHCMNLVLLTLDWLIVQCF